MGHVNKPHGTKGEVFVWPLTDRPEHTFVPGVVLRMAGPDDRTPDPDLPPLRVDDVRPFKRGYLVRFGGIADRNQADLLRGRYLLRPLEELGEPGEGEVYYHEMLEMRVLLEDGTEVGRVREVYELRPTDLLEVRGEGGTHLIPYAKDLVVSVDREGRTIVIDPPDGLLDL